jgi:hypothetical protein
MGVSRHWEVVHVRRVVVAMSLLVVLLVVLLSGCGGGGGPSLDPSLIGNWQLFATSDTFTGPKTSITGTGFVGSLTLRADGTYSYLQNIPGQGTTTLNDRWSTLPGLVVLQEGSGQEVLSREGNLLYFAGIHAGSPGFLWWQKV